MIHQDDMSEDATEERMIGRRELPWQLRLGAVLLFIVFCTIVTVVLLKATETVEESNSNEAIKGSFSISDVKSNITEAIANQTTTTTAPNPTVKDIAANNTLKKRRAAQNAPATPQKKKSGTPTEVGFSPLYRKPLPVCTSLRCKKTGSRMLNLLDNAADPCEDFHQFACGGIKDEPVEVEAWKKILDQVALIDNSSPASLQTYKTFYDSCVKHEKAFVYSSRIASVSKIVKDVGGTSFDKTEEDVDLTQLFAKLILHQSAGFMDIGIEIDKKDTNFALKLSIPTSVSVLKEIGPWLILSDDQLRCLSEQQKELLAKDIDLTKVHEAYVNCQKKQEVYLDSIVNVVRALGFLTGDTANQDQQIQDLKTTITTAFLNYVNDLPQAEQRNAELYKKYVTKKISDLQASFKIVQWKSLMETLTGQTIEETTTVQVYFSETFTKMFSELEKLPKGKVKNAVIAMFAKHLYENLVIPQASHNREDYCIRLASNLLPDVASNLYMKTWTDQEVTDYQNLLTKIYTQLKAKLTAGIEKVQWIDAATKTSMLAKLKDGVTLLLNKKDDIYNDVASLNARYQNVVLNGSQFIENTAIVLETSKKLSYGLYGKPYDVKYIWSQFVGAFDDNPKSFYSTGLIVIPMGVVEHPVKEEFPGYLRMAHVGLRVARELARQFDLVGIEHSITLSEASKQAYSNFKNNMEDKVLLTGTKMHKKHKLAYQADPQLSSNERIVDNAAVRMISDALHTLGDDSVIPWISSSYSIEKVYFLAVAQEFCKNIDIPEYIKDLFESETLPPQQRVENIITNSDAFTKVFECPAESAMNKNPHGKSQFPYL